MYIHIYIYIEFLDVFHVPSRFCFQGFLYELVMWEPTLRQHRDVDSDLIQNSSWCGKRRGRADYVARRLVASAPMTHSMGLAYLPTSRWWFHFFFFIPIWGNDPIWLYFRWVETTNQYMFWLICTCGKCKGRYSSLIQHDSTHTKTASKVGIPCAGFVGRSREKCGIFFWSHLTQWSYQHVQITIKPRRYLKTKNDGLNLQQGC